MDDITEVEIRPLEKERYIHPYTMHFTHAGKKRTWDLLCVHDSVAIIIYNVTRKVLILVKQFRPAVYYSRIPPEERVKAIDVKKYPGKLGVTLELCAGITDKDLDLVEIAREEVLEETGYDVPREKLERVASCRSGVGSQGSAQTTYYCEVTDAMKVNEGGGVESEIIEVVEMTIPEIEKYLSQSQIISPPSFLFAIYWFLLNKSNAKL